MSLLEQYDGFLFDLDGTVVLGDQPLPGAVEVLQEIVHRGKNLIYLTNNPFQDPRSLAETLVGLHLPADEQRIFTSGLAAARLVVERCGTETPTFVMGAPALHAICRRQGLIVTADGREPVSAAIVGGFMEFTYDHLRQANWAARSAEWLIATNRDAVFPTPEGPWPGTGAIVAAVEMAAGRRAEIAGKPEPAMFLMAAGMLPPGARLLMIGDSPDADILGGNRAGMDTALVMTGNGKGRPFDDGPSAMRPTYVLASLMDMLG